MRCRQVHVGVSAHQKLEKLLEVVQLLGYESLCVFGDCFDEIVLLDPQRFPSAIKKFAKEVRPLCVLPVLLCCYYASCVSARKVLGKEVRPLCASFVYTVVLPKR